MKTSTAIFTGSLLGVVLSAMVYTQFFSHKPSSPTTKQDNPLYWVAPMDANYRRDQPGKSPMGMDLVPVFANDNQQDDAGVVIIAPNVVNNLGVRTAKVVSSTLQVPIKTVGYVQYNENNLQHVHPRVEGWIDTLYIKSSGARVSKGESLYALYSPELVNAQEEYLLATKRKNNELIAAAQSRLLALQMPLDSIKQLKKDQKVQQSIVFTAPQSGVIDNLAIREGFYVKPGTTLMSIGGLDDVWVKAEIFERQAAQVKAGQLVTMTLGFVPGKIWHGQVDYVYPTLDAKTRTLRVRLRFDNQDRLLKPNMFAQVIIHTDSEQPTLLVPKEAVIRTGTQNRVVLVTGQGQYKSVAVNLGRVSQQYAEILQGLVEGDEVVTSAQFLLDSESSISSDFMRMERREEQENLTSTFATAQVEGVVNQLNPKTRIINISRGPIEKWNREPATMDFVLAEPLSLTFLKVGDKVDFNFEIQHGDFVIVRYQIINQGKFIEQEYQHD
jgi:Cu(I)/Ag(I) efflux system membrane fusion protein